MEPAAPAVDVAVEPGSAEGAVTPMSVVSELFEGHARRLVGALIVYVGDRGEAEDLAQEAFARVLGARRRIEDPGRAVSYLYSTAFNLARSRWRRQLGFDRAIRRLTLGDHEDGADVLVLQAAATASTSAAVEALPERQRACIVLHYYGELSVHDVGVALKISPNSVKTHLQRGLATLRPALGSEDQP